MLCNPTSLKPASNKWFTCAVMRRTWNPGQRMKNAYALLRQKELDLERVRREVDALRFVLPLLIEPPVNLPGAESATPQDNRWPLRVSGAMPAPYRQ
jgi:hypothetical protein